MPQNVANAFLRAVSPFVATSLGPAFLAVPVCPGCARYKV